MITVTIPGYVVPSQNITMRRHWSAGVREGKAVSLWIRRAMSLEDVCMKGHFRYVEIMCYRPRLISDIGNYIGGSKKLVDQLTKNGAISDDDDKSVHITYRQATLKHSPAGKPLTIIRISADPIPSES